MCDVNCYIRLSRQGSILALFWWGKSHEIFDRKGLLWYPFLNWVGCARLVKKASERRRV